MRIAILSGGEGWHVRDLRRALTAAGHDANVLDFRKLGAGNVSGERPLDGYDAVIVRTMPAGSLEQVVFRMDLLHLARLAGVTILNPPGALEVCVDKFLATMRLEHAGLRAPKTIACQTADAAMQAFFKLGEDVVVKPLFGSEGRGMFRVTDPELASRAFRALERLQTVIYVQTFYPHRGWDLRVLVLGGRVIAAMRRYAKDGEWRTNVAQGGRAEAVSATVEEEQLALQAAAAVGADFAGVDLLPNLDLVLEVNAVPGWRALAPTCGVDVAAAVVEHLARVAK